MKKKNWDCPAVQITIFFTPLIQASTTLKGAFLSVSKSGPDSVGLAEQNDTVEHPKKRAKIGGAICNAAASCNFKANYKNDTTKAFFVESITSFCLSLQESHLSK